MYIYHYFRMYIYTYMLYTYVHHTYVCRLQPNVDVKNVTDVGEVLGSCIIYSEEQVDVLLEHALTGSTKGMHWTNRL